MLTDGRYADANEWHERSWKNEALPPFLDEIKSLREWFEEQERREDGNDENLEEGDE